MASTNLADDLMKGVPTAAKFLGESDRAVYHMVEKGHIPFVRKGGSLFFRKSELNAAFSSTQPAE